MAYDHTDDQDMALEMITEYGRAVQIELVAAASGDVTKPWKGTSAVQPAAESYTLPMVFVPPSSASELGLKGIDEALLKSFSQLVICGPGSAFTRDLKGFTFIVDEDVSRWRILWSETLRPGSTNVLYFFGVAR